MSGYAELRTWSEMFADAQAARVACANRAGRAELDAETYKPQLDAMKTAEQSLGLAMRRSYRRVAPEEVVRWQKATVGIGEHLMARLLGEIGHPIHTTVHEWKGEGSDRTLVVVGAMDRQVSDLWSYCGHGDPDRRRRKGMSAEEAAALGSPRAKMLTRLLAEGCMKQRRSPYRDVYDDRRAQTAASDRDWSDGHMHSDALRITGKRILQDLWRVTNGQEPHIQ